MVNIKQLSKSEKEEGLTLEMVNDPGFNKQYSPVVLQAGDEPIKLIECSTGYWVLLDDDSFLKDKKGMYVVSFKDAQIGRARYILNYKAEIEAQDIAIFERAIQAEICRLKEQVDAKVTEDISKIRQILVMGGKIIPEGLEAILLNAIAEANGNDPYGLNYRDKDHYERNKKAAEDIATDELMDAYEVLKRLSDQGDYDTLYQHYFQDGLPLIASFNNNNPDHIKAMVRSFSKDNIMATIDEIQSKDHLYMVAKFNVEKRG